MTSTTRDIMSVLETIRPPLPKYQLPTLRLEIKRLGICPRNSGHFMVNVVSLDEKRQVFSWDAGVFWWVSASYERQLMKRISEGEQ